MATNEFTLINNMVDLIKNQRPAHYARHISLLETYIHGEYASPGENDLQTTKFDTTIDVISSDASDEFCEAMFPEGLKSILVSFEKLKNYIASATSNMDEVTKTALLNEIYSVEDFLSNKIHYLLAEESSNFMEAITLNIREYIDYGNALLVLSIRDDGTIFIDNKIFKNIYFFNDRAENSIAAVVESSELEYKVQDKYPDTYKSKKAVGTIASTTKKIQTLYLDAKHHDSLASRMSPNDLAKIESMASTGQRKNINGKVMYEYVIVDNALVSYREHGFMKIFVGTTQARSSDYGVGRGLKGISPIVMANVTEGMSYNSLLNVANPSNYVLHGTTLTDGLKGEGSAPSNIHAAGSRTIVGVANQVREELKPIAAAIQRTIVPEQQLQTYMEMNVNSRSGIEKAYATVTFNPLGSEVGKNINDLEMSIRMNKEVRNFRAKSNGYYNQILSPLLKTIMNMMLVKEQEVEVQKLIVKINKTLGFDLNDKERIGMYFYPDIIVRSSISDSEYQLELMNIRVENQALAEIAQMQQALSQAQQEGGEGGEGGESLNKLLTLQTQKIMSAANKLK